MNITERIKNLKSDFDCKDYEEMATLSDLEFVACECIKRNRRYEGCNLLTAYGRLTASRGNKREDWRKQILLFLEDAEQVLA